MKECTHCGSKKYYFTIDKRGVPEVRCRDCDSFITKSSSQDMYNYFQAELYAQGITLEETEKKLARLRDKDSSVPCKYCTERWAILDGRMGIRPREIDDIKFCPMCGRELQPTDKNY